MAALSDPIKTHIVQALARYDSPSSVVESVREAFGVDVTPSQVAYYNPETVKSANLAGKWKRLFEETRAAFVETVAGEAAAHKAVRIRRLSRWADRAERMGNLPLAASLYEQIAKEMGEAYTNRRVLQGDPERPLAVAEARGDLRGLTTAEKLARYQDIARAAGAAQA